MGASVSILRINLILDENGKFLLQREGGGKTRIKRLTQKEAERWFKRNEPERSWERMLRLAQRLSKGPV